MKARAELLDLNYKPRLKEHNFTCSLCNLLEDEMVFHFNAKCPILMYTRRRWLEKSILNREEFLSPINGKAWEFKKKINGLPGWN